MQLSSQTNLISNGLESLIVPAFEKIVKSDPVVSLEIAEALGLADEPKTETNKLWAVLKTLLSSKETEDKELGFSLGISALLHFETIDQSGETLVSILANWQSLLFNSVREIVGKDATLQRQNSIEILSNPHITEARHLKVFLKSEAELANWLLELIVRRASTYRLDLEELQHAIKEFRKIRQSISISTSFQIGRSHHSKLQSIPMEQELNFIQEILDSVDRDFAEFERENLPEPLANIIKAQILQPVYIHDLDLEIVSCDISAAVKELGIPESEMLSAEEMAETQRLRALKFVIDVGRRAAVFYDRSSYTPKRCAQIDELAAPLIGRETELIQMLTQVEKELCWLIPYPRELRSVITDITDIVFDKFDKDDGKRSCPICHVHFIDADKMTGAVPIAIAFCISWHELELPMHLDETEAKINSTDSQSMQDNSAEADQNEVEQETTENEETEDEVVPMSIAYTILRGDEYRDFFEYADLTCRWFLELERLIQNTKQDPTSEYYQQYTEVFQSADSGVALMDKGDLDSWRYFGLTNDECQQHFLAMFRILETSFPSCWELIPALHKAVPSITPIHEYSPVDQALDLLKKLQSLEPIIRRLSDKQKAKISDWLECFSRDCDPSTTDLLTCAETWEHAARLFNGTESWENTFFNELKDHRNIAPGEYIEPQLHLISTVLNENVKKRLSYVLNSDKVLLDTISLRFIECLERFPATRILQAIKHFESQETNKTANKNKGNIHLPEKDWHIPLDTENELINPQLKASANSVWENIVRVIERGQV